MLIFNITAIISVSCYRLFMMLSDFLLLLCLEHAKGPIIAWGVVSIIHFVQIGKILFLPKQKNTGKWVIDTYNYVSLNLFLVRHTRLLYEWKFNQMIARPWVILKTISSHRQVISNCTYLADPITTLHTNASSLIR